MVKRKLEESTVQQRLTNYNSHVSFHLYQMYNEQKKRLDAGGEQVKLEDLRGEINRMGTTLVKIMDVASH
jgi:hypothetical protein